MDRETDIEPEFISKVKGLLKTTYFTKVRYCGEIWMIAYKDRPSIFMGYDVEFYDQENDTWDNPREYIPGSPIKLIMNEVVQIFVDNNVEEGFELSI